MELPSRLDSKHHKLIDDLNSAAAQEFDNTLSEESVNLFQKHASRAAMIQM